jgi:CheY-like chemotaxis protein
MSDTSHRVLVIDDNPWIHDDVRKVLATHDEERELARLEREMLGAAIAEEPADRSVHLRFEIDSARQGREGVEAARRARGAGRPYTVAFVDIRMPPGWDGIETIERLWEVDPDVQTVICSAYSDYSWNAIQRRIGGTDRLLVLKKPFDAIEIAQLAHTLARKWSLQRAENRHAEERGEPARAGGVPSGLAEEIDGLLREVGESLRLLRSTLGERAAVSAAGTIPPVFDTALEGLGRIAKILRGAKLSDRDP